MLILYTVASCDNADLMLRVMLMEAAPVVTSLLLNTLKHKPKALSSVRPWQQGMNLRGSGTHE